MGYRGKSYLDSGYCFVPSPLSMLGDAIWHVGGVDMPIKIVAHVGTGPDGREYVSIEGSSTCIPLDAVRFSLVHSDDEYNNDFTHLSEE